MTHDSIKGYIYLNVFFKLSNLILPCFMNLQAEKSTAGNTENFIIKILNGEIAACETEGSSSLCLHHLYGY